MKLILEMLLFNGPLAYATLYTEVTMGNCNRWMLRHDVHWSIIRSQDLCWGGQSKRDPSAS